MRHMMGVFNVTSIEDYEASASEHSAVSGPVYILIAFVCTAFACVTSIVHILRHLQNYTEPVFQRYIVRIIFMVPVYALMSFLALFRSEQAIWFNTIRDVYEAWVIYNFLALCLAWVGGPGQVVVSLSGRLMKPSWTLMTCCFNPIPLDGLFLRKCKQGTLQFVILKPVLAAATLILYSKGLYNEGHFGAGGAYLYLTFIYTISYSLALYVLLLFYFACHDLLRPYKPLPKFVVIKSVVFLTYWQGVLVFLMVKAGWVANSATAADLQNLMLCVEMAIAALGHMYAFPHADFANAPGVAGGLGGSITHAMAINDVAYDTLHNFAPTYHDYILYSDGTAAAPRRFRTRTFVPTGHEMSDLRKGGKDSGWSSGLERADRGSFSSGYSSGSGNSSPEKKPAGLKNVETAPSNLLDAPAPIVLETDDMEIGLNKVSDSSKGDPDRGQARRSSVMSTVDEEGGQEEMYLRAGESRRTSMVSADSRRSSGLLGIRDEDLAPDALKKNKWLVEEPSSAESSRKNSYTQPKVRKSEGDPKS